MLINPYDFGQRHLNYAIMLSILFIGLGLGYITGRASNYKNENFQPNVAVNKSHRLGKMMLCYSTTNMVWIFDLDKQK